MNDGKVLLLELTERTSAAGRPYLSGWLGKASVVGFRDRERPGVWCIFVSEPRAKADQPERSGRPSSREGLDRKPDHPRLALVQPSRRHRPLPPGELDDPIDDLQ